MRRGDESGTAAMYVALGACPVLWLGLRIAPVVAGGLPAIVRFFPSMMERPFDIAWTEDTVACVLLCLFLYALGIAVWWSTRRNYRRREEYGSAKWGNAQSINRQLADITQQNNVLLTQHVRLGLDSRRHRRNLHVLVVGGSGSGKTRFFVKPNLLQANTSFVVLDPKGELVQYGGYLKKMGYEIRVFDLVNMEKSMGYNPFAYLRCDEDVQKLTTILFKATTPKGSSTSEPFWDTTAAMLLNALVFYLHYEAVEEEQNFDMVMEMLREGEVKEEDDSYLSPLDILFEQLAMRQPSHIAVKYYKSYHSGSGKTLKSIQITLAARLEKFMIPAVSRLTAQDELDLSSLGNRKTALFAIIPDTDTSYNFLISILYTQLFQQLIDVADKSQGGRLPVHVRFLMDEFANLALPNDFETMLATMRSREISVAIILQNITQLKALYEKQWENIIGLCDTYLYLGGNEPSTHKQISETYLGKETIDLNTYGQSKGHSGNYSTNWQLAGRELLTPDEVRMLDFNTALLFIRGERPIMDSKIDLLKLPGIDLTPDGGAPPYIYDFGLQRRSTASPQTPDYTNYALLSDTELKTLFDELEGEIQ